MATKKENKGTIDETGAVPALVIYKGQNERGKHVFIDLPDEQMNDGKKTVEQLNLKAYCYSEKLFNKATIGCIYSVKFKSNSIIYSSSQISLNFWKNETDRAAWRALHNANVNQKKVLQQAAKNMLHEALKPVRQAYFEADYPARTLIIAEVINYITKAGKI